MSNFSGLSIAGSGLRTHAKRLDIIGENIANVDTPGYHRQRVTLSSLDRDGMGLFSGTNPATGGVEYTKINRIKNYTLELHARQQGSVSADRTNRADLYRRIEEAVGGLDEGGLHDQINSVLNAFDDLANSPDDLAIRQVVLQRGQSLADGFSRTTEAIDQLREREVIAIADNVDMINALTAQIAELDGEILGATNFNSEPNSLMDERDQKIVELAEIVDIEVTEFETGIVAVSLDGQLLISNGESSDIAVQVTADPTLAILGYDRVAIVSEAGRELTVDSGEMAASLNAVNGFIPDERRAVDTVIDSVITQINTLHQAGSGLDGSTGLRLFEHGAGPGRMVLSTDVADQPEKLAAGAVGGGVLDNTTARAIAQLGESATGPASVFAEAVGALAARVATAATGADAAAAASAQATALAQSAGGVSLDEELTDLITTQRAYEASARMITVVDEMLNTLVNGTGRVGR